MARRFRAQFTGLGDSFTIVEISRADLDLHSRYGYECTSPRAPLPQSTTWAVSESANSRRTTYGRRDPESAR
jgi:hypothetical protein